MILDHDFGLIGLINLKLPRQTDVSFHQGVGQFPPGQTGGRQTGKRPLSGTSEKSGQNPGQQS